MLDPTWLAQEAKTVHGILESFFYAMVTTLLLLGVFVEYFKWPLGNVPSFAVLVGRALVGTILLHTYTDVANILGTFSDELATRVGDLNEFKLVLSRMGEKLGEFSASWVSVKETLTVVISFLGFFALYFSVYVAEGVHLFTWTLCYVFSPVLIALYVLPATSGSTRALYRTLFEVAAWKPCWAVLATLLWSSALTDLNQPGGANFIAVICMNLMLASSLLATPWVVHALATSGLAGFTRTLGAVAVGTATISPARLAGAAKSAGNRVVNHSARRRERDESSKPTLGPR
jgi:hypothetical protein